MPHLTDADETIAAISRLIRAAQLFEVPIVVTEQNPSKLGLTIEPIRDLLGDAYQPSEKQIFSSAAFTRPDRTRSVLCGIETHICVLQTAFDLVASGRSATVVGDACTSRDAANHSASIPRLTAAGVTVATTEMVLFEWCRTADDKQFRDLSRIVRG